jgi:hypothetical protein
MRDKLRFQDFCYQNTCQKAYEEALKEAKLVYCLEDNKCFLYNVEHSTDFDSVFS